MRVAQLVDRLGWQGPVFALSAINKAGCSELTYQIQQRLDEMTRELVEARELEKEYSPHEGA